LVFDFYDVEDIEVKILNGVATLIPKAEFSGKVFLFFIANDSKDIGFSNLIEVEVKEIKEKIVQGKARVGKPVKWTKEKKGIDNLTNTIKLDYEPINITVIKKLSGRKSLVGEQNIKVKSLGKVKEYADYKLEKKEK